MLGGGSLALLAADSRALLGYAFALVSALIWATYSLASIRRAGGTGGFPTAAVGLFCATSGVLALLCHGAFEASYHWTPGAALLIVVLGLGPMGSAFFLWDAALKRGDARSLGSLAYLTPLLSTLLLGLTGRGRLGWSSGVALVLIVGGALLGSRASRPVAGPPATLPEPDEMVRT
jgi:drug/metabolite transporter (DMT)-like permease